ncbi:MAG: tetratricopeptide repeat protein [Saprospiraceae bacterium]|nr:tetratricopeptide repeat protein [Saprospiraceae bacterium]
MESKRKLAAILFSDIVGYTALMDEDEDKAFALLRRNLLIQRPIVERYNGKWLKEIGDGVLASFASTSEAVSCAKEIMSAAIQETDLSLRIGIHQGEVIFKEGDVFGGGVNISSRIQELAPPNGIWISEPVYRNISNKKDFKTEFIGEQKLRHVREPIKLYEVKLEGSGRTPISGGKLDGISGKWILMGLGIIIILLVAYFVFQGQDEKSIAVLPFKNLSNDPETEYFVEGIWREIQSNLARIGNLRVTSQTSVEQFREDPRSAMEIGKDLSVNQLVEGNVQRFGDQMRINIQLIDATNDNPIWGDSYDRQWKDILQLQNTITLRVVQLIEAHFGDSDFEILNAATNTKPEVHDLILKGNYYINEGGFERLKLAQQMFENAITIDSNYALAWFGLGNVNRLYYHFSFERTTKQKTEAKEAFDRALLLSPDLLEARFGQALYYYSCELDFDRSIEIIEELLSRYPNNARLKGFLSHNYRRKGEFVKALDYSKEMVSLEPKIPGHWSNQGFNQSLLRNYSEAEQSLKRMIALDPESLYGGYVQLALLQIDLDGNTQRAKKTLDQEFLRKEPDFHGWWSRIEILDRNFPSAEYHWKLIPGESASFQGEYLLKSHGLAMIYHFADNDSAKVLFNESINPLKERIKKTPDDHRLYVSLGLAYAGSGEKQKALELSEKALEIMDSSIDALRGAAMERGLIRNYIMIKEYDRALSLIRKLLDHPSTFTVTEAKLNPLYDPLRNLPEFQAILNNPKYQIKNGE